MMPVCAAEISDASVETQRGTKNGKDWMIQKQRVYVQLPWEKYPVQFVTMLPKDAKPYAVGRYTTVPQATMNKYGDRLEIEVRSLMPISAVK